jgi:SSS family solute:Na+ symporter
MGVSGLVVSAMFAAAMSSIDSGVNSITAVVTTDYLDRFGLKPKTERGHVLMAKILAMLIGATVVVGSCFMGQVPGNIMAVTNKTVNLLTSPIFGLFFFALFIPFVRPAGVWVGTICGTITAACIAFSGPIVTLLYTRFGIPVETFGVELQKMVDPISGTESIIAQDPISFQWIGPTALLVDIVVGTAVCWLISGGRRAGGRGSRGSERRLS